MEATIRIALAQARNENLVLNRLSSGQSTPPVTRAGRGEQVTTIIVLFKGGATCCRASNGR